MTNTDTKTATSFADTIKALDLSAFGEAAPFERRMLANAAIVREGMSVSAPRTIEDIAARIGRPNAQRPVLHALAAMARYGLAVQRERGWVAIDLA